MKKSTIAIIGIIIILLIAVCVFALLNRGNLEQKKALQENAEFLLKLKGEEVARVSMEDMQSYEPVEFSAVIDTSTTDPTDSKFTGVELKKIFAYKGIDISSFTTFEVSALDGYASALSYDEVMQDGNVYIVITREGQPLAPKSQGGMGPYLMIIKSSQFSQRWCKFVQEVNVK